MTEGELQHLTLSEAFPDYSEITGAVRKDRSFNMTMQWPECRRTTLPLMLASAVKVVIFGAKRSSRYGGLLEGVLIPNQGKHLLDLNQELIAGREGLWTTHFTAWNSMLALVPNDPAVVQPILATCFGPRLVINWRTDYSRSATRMAMAATEDSTHIGFYLAGIEDFNLVAHPDVVADYVNFVAENCKISKVGA